MARLKVPSSRSSRGLSAFAGSFRQQVPSALRDHDFALLWAALLSSGLAAQMVQVAIGWQVYAIHRSAFDLGLIGLVGFAPVPLLTLPAGQLADRVPRTRVFAASLTIQATAIGLLLVVTIDGSDQLWPFIALAATTGAAGAFGNPAARALPTELVSLETLPSAMALRSIAVQGANVGGPALGGLLFAVNPKVAYGAGVAISAVGVVLLLLLRQPGAERGPVQTNLGFERFLLGLRFVRATPVILGAITLDLFAVLFGGAVALLPLFARSILHTGPVGLGILRSGPAAGALVAGVLMARRPIRDRAGARLLVAVGVFGVCMIVFGLSHWFLLSYAALLVSGYADMFSVNIRATTVALAAPNALRGRVNAVEQVFIGASNELGAFESGAAAALIGALPAVVIGGAVTVALALVWGRLFPALARVDRLEDVQPASAYAGGAL